MVVVCLVTPVAGWLSDVFGRRAVLGSSCALAIVAAYPLFLLMESGSAAVAVVAHIGLGVILALFLGPNLIAMLELFPTRVRYTGFSLGYNFAVSAFGGTAPFLVTFVITRTGITASASFYLILAALVSIAVILLMPETAPRRRSAEPEPSAAH